jgi:dTDP-4-dehydrorhamnose reductase
VSRPIVIVPGRLPAGVVASSSDSSSPVSRWLVTGAAGMLGTDLMALLSEDPSVTVVGAAKGDLDLTDAAAVREYFATHSFDVVVNAAAWTNVDLAETEEAAATAVNGDAVRYLASACAETGAKLISISTDYVFAGDGTAPYREDAPTAPINAYGRSKLVGEQAVLSLLPNDGYIVRTAWLYGAHGPHFVATMLKLAADRETLDVVDDQRGQPTWTVELARQLIALGHAALAGRAPAGVYHGTGSGETTWFGLARAAFELSGLDPERIRPTTSDKFVRPAKRPAYSVLGHDRWAEAGLEPLGDWREALVRYLGA